MPMRPRIDEVMQGSARPSNTEYLMHADLPCADDSAVDLAEEPEEAEQDGADFVLDRCEAIAGHLRELLQQAQAAHGSVSPPVPWSTPEQRSHVLYSRHTCLFYFV